MHHDFWHQRWQTNQIGFHLPEANPLLVKYFSTLSLQPNSRIFLPLCGKTLDIAWLLAQGYQVVGAELSPLAIEDLFRNLNLTPAITQKDRLTHYAAPNLDIFVGDIFELTPALLGSVDVVYDRAALVALPTDMRKRYATHLVALTECCPQFIICFEYDQSLHEGPPFSVSEHTIKQYYQQTYDIRLLDTVAMADGLKGKYPATEHVWWLIPHR